jgi:hypothetical protein
LSFGSHSLLSCPGSPCVYRGICRPWHPDP